MFDVTCVVTSLRGKLTFHQRSCSSSVTSCSVLGLPPNLEVAPLLTAAPTQSSPVRLLADAPKFRIRPGAVSEPENFEINPTPSLQGSCKRDNFLANGGN